LEEAQYLDWNNSIQILNKAYEAGLFVLIIGPKGTGKTSLVRDFAKNKNINLDSINFSLRTRESHLVGTKTLTDGTVSFDEGLLIKSMKSGDMLYLDEINSAEADVLLRLDEALDDRRQIVLKESTGELIKAKENWFVVATINPLTHSGTKELPPQLLSRFPVRIRLEYPPENIELEIIEELFYSPSLRETIAFAKLLDKGMTAKEVAEIVFGNVYTQWGDIEYQKVSDIITSMFGN